MNAVGKIGVIIPEIIDSLNYEFLDGIHTEAKRLGYDVIAFTGVFNSQVEFQYDSYILAMENIYELVCRVKLDGIIYAADMFYNAKVKNRLYDILAMTDVPSITLGEKHEGYISVFLDQRESFREITEHLIVKHGQKRIYCMTGYAGHYDSEERLAGYKDAMERHGLYYDDSYILYGNFWTEEPKKIAAEIAKGTLERPDGVVCANDIMAISFIDALKHHGICVPDDISVTGFDGRWEAYMNIPQVTTVCGTLFRHGIDAVDCIAERIGCTVQRDTNVYQKIRYGSSCGCSLEEHVRENEEDNYLKNHVASKLSRALRQKCYMASNYISLMSRADEMKQLIIDADKRAHIIPGWECFDICLCSDWLMDLENPENYRRTGFTDKMNLVLSKRYPENEACDYLFPTENILPCLNKPHMPQLWILISLHANDQIFGYAALSYKKVNDLCFDESFVNWMDAFGNGLIHLQRRLYQKHQQEQLKLMSEHDPETGIYNKKGFLQHMPAFMDGCRNTGKRPFLLLLSNICKSGDIERTGVNASPIIANALRFSASKDEVFARLEQNIFAVAIAAANESDINVLSENRILALERKVQYIQGNIAGMSIPELVWDSCFIEGSIATIMERQLVRITEKASAAVNTYADYHEQLQQLRREIYLNPQLDWSITTILKRLRISRSHFQRIYKKQFAVTCLDDVIQAKMEKAQQLLLYTDMRIQEIAEQCGYNNEAHFMRQFKDKFGVTAANFRKGNK